MSAEQTPMTAKAAAIRLAQYGERTATYDSGTERALHEIALTMAAEVERLREWGVGLGLLVARKESELIALRAELAARPRRTDVLREAARSFEERCPDASGGLDLCMCHAADELYRMAAATEVEQPVVAEDTAPSPVQQLVARQRADVYLSTPCDACHHTLNWHRNDVGCTVCVCGRFQAPGCGGPDCAEVTPEHRSAASEAGDR
ncbi:hypothetical protein QNO07_09665 [Streptomyces sp. 549]|uniref:hypothetical protein n=1 Tax=Streptomyces sp. 549 TaxID=3049076 RepID=UPI0024C454F4|nr:hypothetical protein [Streptomyces sp. 549]MDK1473687.1 hypothetical protein [Streptomyces sp. 549]